MMAKPMISKALANKIRRAQHAVTEKRRSIIYGEGLPDRLRDELSEIRADYRADKFADTAFENRTAYVRQKLEREAHRQPERWAELAQLEAKLEQVEDDVLKAVPRINPKLERVKWPRGLSSFDTVAPRYRQQLIRELAEQDRRRASYYARLDAEREREDARFAADMERIWRPVLLELVKAVKSGEMTQDAALALIRKVAP